MGSDAERTHLIGRDRKGVHIRLFPSDALFKPFWCHITNATMLTGGSTTLYCNEGVVDDLCDPKVSNACCALSCDQNISLSMKPWLA